MSDLFNSLGGLMKGLSGLMPQDDPKAQLMKLQGEVSELKKQEKELYIEIGKKAEATYGLDSFGEAADRMKLVRANLAAAEQKLAAAQGEAEKREAEERKAKEGRTCPQCGHVNNEGTNFCQECGSKLGVQNLCPECGAENPPGMKFCNNCGKKLQQEPTGICPQCGHKNAPGTRFCGECGENLEV